MVDIAKLIFEVVGSLTTLWALKQKQDRGEQFTPQEQSFLDMQVEQTRELNRISTGH